MSKDTSDKWLEYEQFKKFFQEYLEQDSYTLDQDEKLRMFVTFKSLYQIYTILLNTKTNVQKFESDLSKINKVISNVDKGLNSLGNLVVKQENINKIMRFEVRVFFILIIALFLVFVYYVYIIFS